MNRFGQPQINNNNNFIAANDHITRISDINPYNANNITLKVKVENKNAVRTYTNAKGDGKMFSCDLVDDSGEIKCTFFNESVEQYEHVFETGKVFIISRSGIKPGNPKFCRTPFEMSINRNTIITEVEDVINTPKRRYTFINSIDQIQDQPINTTVDVIGVIISVSELQQITTKKDGKELPKRSVRIADQSNRNIEITLWGDHACNFSAEVGIVLALKGAKVGEYKGEKNLSCNNSTLTDLNPDIPEMQNLAEWYSQNSDNIASSSMSISGQGGSTQRTNKVETLASIQEQISEGGEKKAIFGKIKGTLMWIYHDDRAPLFYKACLDNHRKVIENPNPGNGKKWLCEATGQYYDNYDLRYLLTCVVGDTSGCQRVTMFNDQGLALLGVPAKEIEGLKESGNSSEMNRIFDAAIFKRFFFVIKATEEMYQDEMKIRCVVSTMEPIDFAVESRRLLDEIDSMLSY
jgi:replication factor A1